jgi:predicted DNA-binding protein with PD1-like motif
MANLAFRLKPGMDLKKEIEAFAVAHELKAGFVVTCVGGLQQVTMRMAGAKPEKQDIRTRTADFEIVSLVGTTGPDGSHLHIAVSDSEGRVTGGHLKEGTIIHPTAEIVLGEMADASFERHMDDETGFAELVVVERQ